MKQTLILASSSEFRRELLLKLQIPFNSVSPKVDETPLAGEKPRETALRLAQVKAKKVGAEFPHALIIGCDQVATLDGEQLGKPHNHNNATKQLQLMRGREVTFHSALCLYNAATGNMQAEVVPYLVRFRTLTDTQIENYLNKEQPYQCAGSAKSEGLGIAIIERMLGEDPNALIGLPLIKLITMLQNEGVDVI
ncbi:MAG: septum formation inhibitor Maf [Methylotenera sp.]|nr:septum formation inhibitor Maf [Methylotenera sp.]